jgi:uncharacterized protein YcbK (DUF882 family)
MIKKLFKYIIKLLFKPVEKTKTKKPVFKKFTTEDFTKSNTADRLGIDNSIKSPRIGKNLIYTICIAERVRKLLGVDINITSGYRCKKLNEAVGGSKTSQHKKAQAFDFTCEYSPKEVCRRLKNSNIPYDQLIREPSWTHIGCPVKKKLRRQFIDLS